MTSVVFTISHSSSPSQWYSICLCGVRVFCFRLFWIPDTSGNLKLFIMQRSHPSLAATRHGYSALHNLQHVLMRLYIAFWLHSPHVFYFPTLTGTPWGWMASYIRIVALAMPSTVGSAKAGLIIAKWFPWEKISYFSDFIIISAPFPTCLLFKSLKVACNRWALAHCTYMHWALCWTAWVEMLALTVLSWATLG